MKMGVDKCALYVMRHCWVLSENEHADVTRAPVIHYTVVSLVIRKLLFCTQYQTFIQDKFVPSHYGLTVIQFQIWGFVVQCKIKRNKCVISLGYIDIDIYYIYYLYVFAFLYPQALHFSLIYIITLFPNIVILLQSIFKFNLKIH